MTTATLSAAACLLGSIQAAASSPLGVSNVPYVSRGLVILVQAGDLAIANAIRQ